MLELKPVKSSRVRKLVFSGAILYFCSFLFFFSIFLFPVPIFFLFLFLWLFLSALFFYRLYRFLLVLSRGEAPAARPEAGSGASLDPAALADLARLILSQSDGGVEN